MRDNESEAFVLAGVLMKRLLSREQTSGQFCLFENTSGGNTKTPIHVHASDDETIYLIEGELTAVIDGRPRRLTSGESIFLPRGTPHQLVNISGSPPVHSDWNSRYVRPVCRGSWSRASTGRNRDATDAGGNRTAPRGFAEIRHHRQSG